MTASADLDAGRLRGEAGQASVELIGVTPAVLLVGLILLQLLAVGYARVTAGAAAEAGALAIASRRDPRAAVREALPRWTRARASLTVAGGRVTVKVLPPSAFRTLSRRFPVTSRAVVTR